MLVSIIEGQSAGEDVVLQSRFINRQSCGCFMHTDVSQSLGESIQDSMVRKQAHTVDTGADNVYSILLDMFGEIKNKEGLKPNILNSFLKSVARCMRDELSKYKILNILFDIVVSSGMQDDNLHLWQHILEIARQKIRHYFFENTTVCLLDNLFRESRLLITDILENKQASKQFSMQNKVMQLQGVSQNLITCFNFNDLFIEITKQLPTLGIASFYCILFAEDISPLNKYFILGLYWRSPVQKRRLFTKPCVCR
jgi:hypothetical protein